MKSGVINNSHKEINRGKMITSFILRTKHLFECIDNNPAVAMHPIDYVNNPLVIMKHKNCVLINSCIQTGLIGQVAAESIRNKQISGLGDQVDNVIIEYGIAALKGYYLCETAKALIGIVHPDYREKLL